MAKETASEFNYETRCVLAQFEYHLPKSIETNGIWKLVIALVDGEPCDEQLNLDGVLEVECSFDYEAYQLLEELGKKEMILALLMSALTEAAEVQGWSMRPFHDTCEKVRALGLNHRWRFKKGRRTSPSGSMIAHVECHHKLKRFTADLYVKKAGEVVKRLVGVIDDPPSEFIFGSKLGEIKWVAEDEVALISKNGSIVCSLVI